MPSPEVSGLDLDQVLQHLPAAVVVVEAPSGRIVHANARARDMTERQLGRPIPPELADDFEIWHPDGRPYAMEDWPLVRSITSGEQVVDEEYFNVLADGSRLVVRCSSSPVYDDERRIVAGVLVMTDITEQKDFEARLTHHARLLENTEDAVIALDPAYIVTSWNHGAERMYGWTADEVLGRDSREIARSELGEEARVESRRQLLETGRTRVEMRVNRKDGTPLDIEAVHVALRAGGGEISGYLGIHRDITERKRAEKALREAHERSETILESITDAFVAVDGDWRYTYINDRALRRMQMRKGEKVTREELLGQSMWEVFPDAVGTVFEDNYRLVMRERRAVEFEAYFPVSDEWLEAHVYPSGTGLAIYYGDVTERKRAHEEMRRSETILESLTDSFFVVDREWRFTYVNRRALVRAQMWHGEELTREDLLGQNYWEVFPDIVGTVFHEEFHRALRDGTTAEFEAYSPPTDSWVEVRAYPSEDGLAVYSRDVSERRRAEEELTSRARQQAAVAELGRLALEYGSLESIMDEAVGLVARTLDVDYAKIAELLPGGRQLVVTAGVGWKPGVVGQETELAGRGSQAGYAVLTGEPVVAEELALDRRFETSIVVQEHEAVSATAVVIQGTDKPFGALAALSTRPRTFSEHDVDFMQAVANVLATAVEHAAAEKRLGDVREAERARIARDLHDEALRELSHALAEAYRPRVASDDSPAGDPLDRLVPVLKRLGQQLRAAIYDLRLGAEDNTAFPDLLEALVGVQRDLVVDGDVHLEMRKGVPPGPLGQRGTEMLRILGEALANARRHSGAANIRVVAWGSPRKLCAEVSDDGSGFDVEGEPSDLSGTGIKGMRERAELLGGDLTIRSEPGVGTRVRIDLRLVQEFDEADETVRVLLVEDHAAVREAIAAAFEREPGFEIAGQASSLAEARRMLEDVDVALVDLGLPDGYGGDLIRELREVNPQAQAVVLTANLDRGEIARAVDSGAAAALNKAIHLDEVVDAVGRLRAGETLLPLDEVVELLRFAGRQRERERDDRDAIARLTPREREVLAGLAEGLDTQGIADRLHIALRTVRNHLASIMTKLGVHSQLQALVFALRYDVVKITEPDTRATSA
jgi:PAS domain S-box-containing protein